MKPFTRGTLAFVAIVTFSDPSWACRGPFSEEYVILEVPPARLPAGAILLAVKAPTALATGMGRIEPADVRILAAKDRRLIGKSVVLKPGVFSSCGRWIESERAKYVVGLLEREAGKLVLYPVMYRSKHYRTRSENLSEGIKLLHSRNGK